MTPEILAVGDLCQARWLTYADGALSRAGLQDTVYQLRRLALLLEIETKGGDTHEEGEQADADAQGQARQQEEDL